MSVLIVEPNPGGHRFARVADVVDHLTGDHHAVLLTSRDVRACEEFSEHLAARDVEVREVFSSRTPTAREVAEVTYRSFAEESPTAMVVMEGDQILKRWWWDAWRAFRRLPARPPVVIMLTRYPTRIGATDWFGWRLRVTKGVLVLAAMATGTLSRVAGFSGRDDLGRGWVVHKTGDPAICAHDAGQQAAHRTHLGLPVDRRLVGVFGLLSERKNVPMIWDAIRASGIDADLVLAGNVRDEVEEWLEGRTDSERRRIHARPGFVSNELLDRYVAAMDVIPLVLTNNGPSGMMGIALAAGVPVVTAGSRVRAHEVVATDGGEAADLTVSSIAAAFQRVFAREPPVPRRSAIPLCTGDTFAAALLGDLGFGRPR